MRYVESIRFLELLWPGTASVHSIFDETISGSRRRRERFSWGSLTHTLSQRKIYQWYAVVRFRFLLPVIRLAVPIRYLGASISRPWPFHRSEYPGNREKFHSLRKILQKLKASISSPFERTMYAYILFTSKNPRWLFTWYSANNSVPRIFSYSVFNLKFAFNHTSTSYW